MFRSSDGQELLASSLDGSVSYIGFTGQEMGEPLKTNEVVSQDIRFHWLLLEKPEGLIRIEQQLALKHWLD